MILVVTDTRSGALRSADGEVLSAAARLASETGQPAAALVLGADTAGVAEAPARFGVGTVYVVEDPKLAPFSPDAAAAAVAAVAQQEGARHVLMAATLTGKDLLARAAHLLDAGLAQDCTALRVEDGDVVFTRPMYAGKLLADVRVTSAPALATLRPKMFEAEERPAEARVERVAVDLPAPQVTVEAVAASGDKLAVTEADVLVSGGRGMQGPEHWALLERLADALGPGTALACSRPVSDEGWRPHEEHVGQTGKTVAPDLYIACGISGAIQHLAGISSSKTIVAINKDPDAPIFKAADYGIVGDVFDVLPALTEAVKKVKAQG
ncbi:MAG: electron transfer flavoprotein subunit alpha/FixB family protein [Rhodothermales bacterium]|nr:electron transfer flavoprotein subunit alpha/FixB family protein [Rhodothermales bacterium]